MNEVQSKLEVLIMYTKDLLNTVGANALESEDIAASLTSLEQALSKIKDEYTLQ